MELRVHEWHGADGAHSARVGAGVAFSDALVVLGRGQQVKRLAVGHHKHAAFNAVHELLDHHALARRAKGGSGQHVLDHLLRFVQVLGDDHPFARSQAVGFQNVGGLHPMEEFHRVVHLLAGERAVSRRRNVVALHEFLGKRLASFQLGARRAWSNHHQFGVLATVLQMVHQPIHERGFGTHNDHVDAVLFDGAAHGVVVGSVQLEVGRHPVRAGISGGHEELRQKRALGQLPSDGVLPSTGANEQDVHARKITPSLAGTGLEVIHKTRTSGLPSFLC